LPEITSYEEISGKGICASGVAAGLAAAGGGKGASQRVASGEEVTILAGNARLMEEGGISYEEARAAGTVVYIAEGGNYVGCIVITDEVKPDSRAAISALKKEGVRKTVMLTGDNRETAAEIADFLSLDKVYSELLPWDKVVKVEELLKEKKEKGSLAFVGDGINDAPVLARADVGIAMGGGGSDAAIEASDVVLMTDEPSKLIAAIRIARKTRRVVFENIFFALGVKGIFLVLGAIGLANMWEAVFADVGVAMIAILNAMRVLKTRL
jgi:Cd2+/Zn2+-exporting ATPase